MSQADGSKARPARARKAARPAVTRKAASHARKPRAVAKGLSVPDDPAVLARAHTATAIAALAAIVADAGVSASARIAAADMLLERGHGKAQTTLDITHRHDPLEALTTDELERIAKALAGADGRAEDAGGGAAEPA